MRHAKSNTRSVLTKRFVWAAIILLTVVPLGASLFSPQLQWRGPVYIVAGFAGAASLSILFLQVLLIGNHLPNISQHQGRRLHFYAGLSCLVAVSIHVVGLWLTSAPDVVDALLLRSPTPFSVWGVAAMWALIASFGLAIIRRPFVTGSAVRLRRWRLAHKSLALIIIIGAATHTMLIDGTMEFYSKAALSVACIFVTVLTIFKKRTA